MAEIDKTKEEEVIMVTSAAEVDKYVNCTKFLDFSWSSD